MHDALTIGIPVLAILFGILWNQQGLRDLRSETNGLRNEMNGLRNEMNGRFGGTDGRLDRMQADLSQFYRTLGQHDAKLEAIEKKS